MPKQSLNEVEQTSAARLLAGSNNDARAQFCEDNLQWYVDHVEAENEVTGQSTFAIGIMNNTLYYAIQGSVKQEAIPSPDIFQVANVVDCTIKGKVDNLNLSGIHAEMMIIRYLVLVLGHNKNNLGAMGLEIASTKGCCLDCAGWLTLHSIPHSKTNDKASLMWRHPITLSLYRHEGTVNTAVKFYEKVQAANGHTNVNVRANTYLTYK